MKYLPNNLLIEEYLEKFFSILSEDALATIGNWITGVLVTDKPTINKISKDTIGGFGERKMNREIQKITKQMPEYYKNFFSKFQSSPKISISPSGYTIMDEKIIEKTAKNIEGVDYFYSTKENKPILGLSLISTHYWDRRIEYPGLFDIYRRDRELEKYGKSDEYRKKNEIARELIVETYKGGSKSKFWLIDAAFFEKENVRLLKSYDASYVSRLKTTWSVTYNHCKWTVPEFYESIPKDEFELTFATNPKSKEVKPFFLASRDVYLKGIGTHRVVFTKEARELKDGTYTEKENGKWRALVTNRLDLTSKEIVELYMIRWSIETEYRDDNQNLYLHGCMWRNIEGQYCYIALVFMAYMFLCWANSREDLDRFKENRRTLGEKKEAFEAYCIEQFANYLSSLKEQCKECNIAKIIYDNLYYGKIFHIPSKTKVI